MKSLTKILSLFLVLVPLSLNAQWSSDAKVNIDVADTSGGHGAPIVKTLPGGEGYVSFYRSESLGGAENYNVYLQKLDVYGNEDLSGRCAGQLEGLRQRNLHQVRNG